MPMQGIGSLNANGFCNQLYQMSSDAANVVVKYAKITGTAIVDGAKKAAEWAKNFFIMLGGYIQKGYEFVKGYAVQGYNAAKNFATNNPKMVVAIGVAFAAGAVITAIFSRCCGKKEEAPVEENRAEVAVLAPNRPENPPAAVNPAENPPVVENPPVAVERPV